MAEISDDNSIMALSTDSSGLRIYTINGFYYTFSQTLQNVSAHIEGIDMTGDGQWLFAVERGSTSAYVYKYNSGNSLFEYFQHFTASATATWAGALTDDHEWLFIGSDTGKVDVYTYDGSTFQFKEAITHSSDEVSSISVTNDHTYLAISNWNSVSTYVYKYNGTNFTAHQTMTIDSGEYVKNFLSNDHGYLLISCADASNEG